MTARSQKEAYLRRHGQSPRPKEPVVEIPTPTPRSRAASEEKTWQEKRKENLLSRARGGRVREVDVGLSAVMFAAKLKRLSSGDSLAALEKDKEDKKKKADGELTWREKRKDAYLRTHHTPRPKEVVEKEQAVSLASVQFAAKLRLSARNSRSGLEEEEATGAGSTDPAASGTAAESAHSTPRSGEKSFAQKRKEALIRRQQAGRKPTEPEVGVSSVLFAAKLKRMSSASSQRLSAWED